MNQELQEKISILEKELSQINEEMNRKFIVAARLFDHLKSKIQKIESDYFHIKQSTDQKKLNYSNCIFCKGKKYTCINYIQQRKCDYQPQIRPAGLDICFDIDGEKCLNLIEIG